MEALLQSNHINVPLMENFATKPERVEQERILDIVKKSYQIQVMQNELIKPTHDSVMGDGNTNGDHPKAMLELFYKMRTHCDFLADLDSLSDMNNAEKLRDVI